MMVAAESKLPNNLPYSLIALPVLVKGAKKMSPSLCSATRGVAAHSLHFFTIDS